MRKAGNFVLGMLLALLLWCVLNLFSGCTLQVNEGYQIGDIVYLKPDSTQGVVTYNKSCKGNVIVVEYPDKLGERHTTTITESEIFKELTNKPKPLNSY